MNLIEAMITDYLCDIGMSSIVLKNVSIFEVTYTDGVFFRTFKCGLLSFFKQAQQS